VLGRVTQNGPMDNFASAGTIYGPVSVSVCPSQVGVLSKWMGLFDVQASFDLSCTVF